MIKKNTKLAEFTVVTPERSKFNKPGDTGILSMIPEGDPPNLTTYLNNLLKRNKPEHQKNIFWFPTPKNSGKTEDHTPMQTRIFRDLLELTKTEKLNPQDKTESETE